MQRCDQSLVSEEFEPHSIRHDERIDRILDSLQPRFRRQIEDSRGMICGWLIDAAPAP